MGLADIRATRQQAIRAADGRQGGRSDHADRRRARQETVREVAGQDVATNRIKVFARAHIDMPAPTPRSLFQLFTLAGAARRRQAPPSQAKMKAAFERSHRAQFGFIDRSKELVIEAVSVEAVGGGARFKEAALKTTARRAPAPARRTRFFSQGQCIARACSRAISLKPGQKVAGPAIVIEPHRPSWSSRAGRPRSRARNHLVLTRTAKLKRARAVARTPTRLMLEVFNNLFMSIAEQMGLALQKTAYSVNIKERARLLLRSVRRRRLAGRQRAAHAGASRLDGSRGGNHHPREQGRHRAPATSTPSTHPTTAGTPSP